MQSVLQSGTFDLTKTNLFNLFHPRYHLGTIAIGALVVAICETITAIVNHINRIARKRDNLVSRTVMGCMQFFDCCVAMHFRFVSRNAYILCAMYGKSFCTSTRDAFELLTRNPLRLLALGRINHLLCWILKLFVIIAMSTTAYLLLTNASVGLSLNYVVLPVIIVMIATYMVANVFFRIFWTATNTLFFCFRMYLPSFLRCILEVKGFF